MTMKREQGKGLDARVAVLVCGYGEVEDNDELVEYNRRSIDLLVSKSLKVPARAVPFLSRRLAKRARAEYERANHFVSPHNAIFQRQRAGIGEALEERFGDRVGTFTAFNFCDGYLPEEVLPVIREAGYDRLVIYPLLVVNSVYTGGLSLEQVNTAIGSDGELAARRALSAQLLRPPRVPPTSRPPRTGRSTAAP